MPSSYRFIVSGRVQGVFFRQSAVERARALGLAGWVRNRDDGRVEGLATGEAQALDAFEAWLHRGPPAAQVEHVEWLPAETPAPAGDFRVRR